jgi:hypothetical protein
VARCAARTCALRQAARRALRPKLVVASTPHAHTLSSRRPPSRFDFLVRQATLAGCAAVAFQFQRILARLTDPYKAGLRLFSGHGKPRYPLPGQSGGGQVERTNPFRFCLISGVYRGRAVLKTFENPVFNGYQYQQSSAEDWGSPAAGAIAAITVRKGYIRGRWPPIGRGRPVKWARAARTPAQRWRRALLSRVPHATAPQPLLGRPAALRMAHP